MTRQVVLYWQTGCASCANTKRFLNQHDVVEALGRAGIRYEAFNAADEGEGKRRHAQAGAPLVPAVVIDGEVFPVQHPVQIASLLGLDIDVARSSTAIAWSLLEVVQRWEAAMTDVAIDVLCQPTPSRGRSVKHLVVNVSRPIMLLPGAWHSHKFHWYTAEADLQQIAYLTSAEEIAEFVTRARIVFGNFLLDHGDALSESDPFITGLRANMRYSELLATQRFHAAFHYRQAVDHLVTSGIDRKHALPQAIVHEIGLPTNLY
jgi:glutaredoxin